VPYQVTIRNKTCYLSNEANHTPTNHLLSVTQTDSLVATSLEAVRKLITAGKVEITTKPGAAWTLPNFFEVLPCKTITIRPERIPGAPPFAPSFLVGQAVYHSPCSLHSPIASPALTSLGVEVGAVTNNVLTLAVERGKQNVKIWIGDSPFNPIVRKEQFDLAIREALGSLAILSGLNIDLSAVSQTGVATMEFLGRSPARAIEASLLIPGEALGKADLPDVLFPTMIFYSCLNHANPTIGNALAVTEETARAIAGLAEQLQSGKMQPITVAIELFAPQA